MITKISCDVCEEEMVLDQNPKEVDRSPERIEFKHQQGRELHYYDKWKDIWTREHYCKSCWDEGN
jgi:hypothetical protein